jgi:hypothetical protein
MKDIAVVMQKTAPKISFNYQPAQFNFELKFPIVKTPQVLI